MADLADFKRKRARRSVLTALLLTVIAVAIYVGFIWEMGRQAQAAKVASGQHAATASSVSKPQHFEIY